MNNRFQLAMLAGLLAFTSAHAEGAPKIKFDQLVYDFGVTSLVESVTGTFTFQNVGGGVLEIGKPKPSCGCTVVKVSADKLQAGEKGELVFVLTLGAATQEQEKIIFVPSNDPENPGVSLHVKAASKIVVSAQPAAVSIGEMRVGTTTNATVLVRRLDDRPLKIARLDSSTDQITATVEPSDAADPKTARVRVEITAGNTPRLLSGQIRVHTDDSLGAALTLSVYARLLGDIKLEPETLAWGMPDPVSWSGDDEDIILSRTLIVTSTQPGKPLKISKLSSNMKDLKLTIEPIEKNKKYLIEATFAHRLTKAARGTISFETNLPSLPKVEVPIEINIWKTD